MTTDQAARIRQAMNLIARLPVAPRAETEKELAWDLLNDILKESQTNPFSAYWLSD